MSINAPILVMTAAGLSVISHGGIQSHNASMVPNGSGGATYKMNPPNAGDVFKFWGSVIVASAGILAIDNWNSQLAKGLAALWIVGGIVINGKVLATWLSNLGEGLSGK